MSEQPRRIRRKNALGPHAARRETLWTLLMLGLCGPVNAVVFPFLKPFMDAEERKRRRRLIRRLAGARPPRTRALAEATDQDEPRQQRRARRVAHKRAQRRPVTEISWKLVLMGLLLPLEVLLAMVVKTAIDDDRVRRVHGSEAARRQ